MKFIFTGKIFYNNIREKKISSIVMKTQNNIVWKRKILHVDMDAFYASIEQRDNPKLRGKPVIVGGNPDGRGVVSTASYEARRFGIHSAMPAAKAKKLCPHAIFLRPDFEKYKDVSNQIHHIFRNYTSIIEPVSLDEAYLDITRNKLNINEPVLLAQMIQQNIYAITKLTASVGVAPNKFLAKIASDMKKPAGLTVVYPEQVESFLKPLAVEKIPGIGPVAKEKLNARGIKTIGDLMKMSKTELCNLFGKWGATLFELARGIDNSPVEPKREIKQISSEETFEQDIIQIPVLEKKIIQLSDEVANRLMESNIKARTITLKIKYADFTLITRSKTLSEPVNSANAIQKEAIKLLHKKTEAGKRLIRLIGVGVSNLVPDEKQLEHKQELNLFNL